MQIKYLSAFAFAISTAAAQFSNSSYSASFKQASLTPVRSSKIDGQAASSVPLAESRGSTTTLQPSPSVIASETVITHADETTTYYETSTIYATVYKSATAKVTSSPANNQAADNSNAAAQDDNTVDVVTVTVTQTNSNGEQVVVTTTVNQGKEVRPTGTVISDGSSITSTSTITSTLFVTVRQSAVSAFGTEAPMGKELKSIDAVSSSVQEIPTCVPVTVTDTVTNTVTDTVTETASPSIQYVTVTAPAIPSNETMPSQGTNGTVPISSSLPANDTTSAI